MRSTRNQETYSSRFRRKSLSVRSSCFQLTFAHMALASVKFQGIASHSPSGWNSNVFNCFRGKLQLELLKPPERNPHDGPLDMKLGCHDRTSRIKPPRLKTMAESQFLDVFKSYLHIVGDHTYASGVFPLILLHHPMLTRPDPSIPSTSWKNPARNKQQTLLSKPGKRPVLKSLPSAAQPVPWPKPISLASSYAGW